MNNELRVRQITKKDFKQLAEWWRWWFKNDLQYEDMLNPNSGFFPADGEGGYIVEKNNENIAAGFLWLTNSKQAFFGYMVSNYKYRQEDRQYAMDVLITTVEQIAKELGYNYIFTITRNMYMQNTMEDLTVSTQAADFQMERGEQQRAGILNALRGAAGSSGIAALAQQLANQGVLQAAQVSAQIAQQERQNQLAQAQAANQLQFAEAQGMSAADMARRGGEAMVQQAEMSRQSTLLGVEFQGLAGANAGVQSAFANQMSAQQAGMQMQMANMQMLTNMGTQLYLSQ